MSEAFQPAARLEGVLRVPGDKSISHRALLVAAIGEGPMEIEGLAPGRDVAASLRAVRALGVAVTFNPEVRLEGSLTSSPPSDFQVMVGGRGWPGLRRPDGPIDVGNSGTTIRVLLGSLAPSDVSADLTGDESIRRRPMARVVDPLRRMGADIRGEAGGDRAPLTVTGAPLTGVAHDLPVPSAQVKTALLLAGLRASGRTVVREPAPSRDHTERLLRHLGVAVEASPDGLVVKSTDLRNDSVSVPGDLSSAAFFLVGAAILPGSDVTVQGVGVNPTRTGILDVLRAFGASVSVEGVVDRCGEPVGTVRVRAADRRPVEVTGELTLRTLDELPLVALLGAFAEGETLVRDAGELRVKESDRISAIAGALGALGVAVRPLPDGFDVLGPCPPGGGVADAAADHRIALTLAIAGLASADGAAVRGWTAADVSYPGFVRDLDRLAVR